VRSSHYSGREFPAGAILQWRLTGMDARGRRHLDLAHGGHSIQFPARQVVAAATAEFTLPSETMLCRWSVRAVDPRDGALVAENYVEYFVAGDYPPALRVGDGGETILHAAPENWAAAGWSGGVCSRDEARSSDACFGAGSGFFEWSLPMGRERPARVRRLRVRCEASSRRRDTPQTSLDLFPSTLHILLNGVLVDTAELPDHPHDARGVLSYLRGGKGAFGYGVEIVVEGELLGRVLANEGAGHLRLRFEVPAERPAANGLTLYGPECGRYPYGTTITLEG
jgi:hypothetical protein